MTEVTAVPLRPVKRSGIVALWVGVGVALAAGIGGAYAASQKAVMTAMPAPQFMAANGKRAGVHTTASGLQYQVLKAGSGAAPTMNDVARVDYKGTLTNGIAFDASKPGQPVPMPLSMVVPGFGEALSLMPPGSRYRIWIPPQLGYGPEAKQNPQTGETVIPANSVLVFDVTLHDFMDGQRFMQMMQAQQRQPGM